MDKQNLMKLNILIMNPENIIYEGEVESISSVNVLGKFDILPMHINFISIIKESILIREQGGREKKLDIDGGIIKVYNNKIQIFLGIEIFKEEQQRLKIML